MGRRSLVLGLSVWILGAILASGAAPAAGDEPPVVDQIDRKVVVLDPVPGAVPHPSKVRLSGRFLAGFRFPSVALGRPNGRAEYLLPKDVRVDGDRFETTLPLSYGKGAYRVEVSATDAAGRTHVAARLRIFAGVPVVREEEALPKEQPADADVSTFVLERRLFAKILALRKTAEVDPLPWLEPLAEVAREHAAACAKANTYEQAVDGAGNVAQRCDARLGWKGTVFELPLSAASSGPAARACVATAVGGGLSVDGLFLRWAREPGPLAALTSPVLTHLACGVARGRGGALFVVVAFAQIGRDDVLKSIEVRYDTLLDDWRKGSAAAKPEFLRELARWGRKEGPRECAKAASSTDLDMKAAALDGQFYADEDAATKAMAALLAKMDAEMASWTSRCRYAFPAARAGAAYSQGGK